MISPETFIYHGEGGEVLRFADLSVTEQRVVLIAAGGLVRAKQEGDETPEVEALAQPAE